MSDQRTTDPWVECPGCGTKRPDDPNCTTITCATCRTAWAPLRALLASRSETARSEPTSAPRELHCEDCDRDYPVWCAPNVLWNKVVRAPSEAAGIVEPFLCLTCFALRAERSGIVPTAWVVRPERNEDMPGALPNVTVSHGEVEDELCFEWWFGQDKKITVYATPTTAFRDHGNEEADPATPKLVVDWLREATRERLSHAESSIVPRGPQTPIEILTLDRDEWKRRALQAESRRPTATDEADEHDTTKRGWEAAVWCLSELQAAEKNDAYGRKTLIANLKDRIQAALRLGPYSRTAKPGAVGEAWAADFNAFEEEERERQRRERAQGPTLTPWDRGWNEGWCKGIEAGSQHARDELEALRRLADQARAYHEDCGHDSPGAAAQCDPVCAAWKEWRRVAGHCASAATDDGEPK